MLSNSVRLFPGKSDCWSPYFLIFRWCFWGRMFARHCYWSTTRKSSLSRYIRCWWKVHIQFNTLW